MRKTRSNLRRLLVIAVGLHLLFVHSISPRAFVIAFLLMLAGQALQLASYTVLVKNTRITSEGVYALMRHPFYVGTALSDLGICWLSGGWIIALAYMAVFFFVYRRRVLREEDFLNHKFGHEYQEYSRLTPRSFPRLCAAGKLRSSSYPVDPSLVFKNRIIPRILNLWAFFLGAAELSDLIWGGDSLWSMDHLVLLMVCVSLVALAAFLDSAGRRLKKAIAQVGATGDSRCESPTHPIRGAACSVRPGRMALGLEGS